MRCYNCRSTAVACQWDGLWRASIVCLSCGWHGPEFDAGEGSGTWDQTRALPTVGGDPWEDA